MKDTIVLGLGNVLMGDEGIGVRIVQELESTCGPRFPQVDFVDAGVGGMRLLHRIAGRRRAVFIDCARMDAEPGTIRRFTPDQVRTRKGLAHQSLHEADLLTILDLSRQLGECPREVILFGIEPERIAEGIGLSSCLESRLAAYVQAVAQVLAY
jgi:hydrogenase maturation protease